MSKCKIVKNSIQFQQITIAVIDAYHNKQLLRDMHQNVSEEEKELAWSRFLLCSGRLKCEWLKVTFMCMLYSENALYISIYIHCSYFVTA